MLLEGSRLVPLSASAASFVLIVKVLRARDAGEGVCALYKEVVGKLPLLMLLTWMGRLWSLSRNFHTAVRPSCADVDTVRGENLRFFPELRHRVAKMLRVLAYDSGGAALPELLRPGTCWPLLPVIYA